MSNTTMDEGQGDEGAFEGDRRRRNDAFVDALNRIHESIGDSARAQADIAAVIAADVKVQNRKTRRPLWMGLVVLVIVAGFGLSNYHALDRSREAAERRETAAQCRSQANADLQAARAILDQAKTNRDRLATEAQADLGADNRAGFAALSAELPAAFKAEEDANDGLQTATEVYNTAIAACAVGGQ